MRTMWSEEEKNEKDPLIEKMKSKGRGESIRKHHLSGVCREDSIGQESVDSQE
jgi:hypothetical protein